MWKNLAYVVYTLLFLGISIYGSIMIGLGKAEAGIGIILLSRIADFIFDIKMGVEDCKKQLEQAEDRHGFGR